jgi:hypothetical protein
MYRLNTPKLVKQITPPHRRTPKRKRVLEMLLHGLTLLWKDAEEQSKVDELLAAYVPQKKVIEFHINRVTGLAPGVITVELGYVPGTDLVGVGVRSPANLSQDIFDKVNILFKDLNITNRYGTIY